MTVKIKSNSTNMQIFNKLILPSATILLCFFVLYRQRAWSPVVAVVFIYSVLIILWFFYQNNLSKKQAMGKKLTALKQCYKILNILTSSNIKATDHIVFETINRYKLRNERIDIYDIVLGDGEIHRFDYSTDIRESLVNQRTFSSIREALHYEISLHLNMTKTAYMALLPEMKQAKKTKDPEESVYLFTEILRLGDKHAEQCRQFLYDFLETDSMIQAHFETLEK